MTQTNWCARDAGGVLRRRPGLEDFSQTTDDDVVFLDRARLHVGAATASNAATNDDPPLRDDDAPSPRDPSNSKAT